MYNFYGNSTIHNPCQKVESKHFAFLLNVTRWSTVSVGERPWITWTVSWLNEYSMGSQKLAEFLKTFILQGGLTFTIMLYFWFWWRYLWTVPCPVLWQPESVGAHKRTWKEKLLNCSPPIYFYTSCILSIAAAAKLSWSGLGWAAWGRYVPNESETHQDYAEQQGAATTVTAPPGINLSRRGGFKGIVTNTKHSFIQQQPATTKSEI